MQRIRRGRRLSHNIHSPPLSHSAAATTTTITTMLWQGRILCQLYAIQLAGWLALLARALLSGDLEVQQQDKRAGERAELRRVTARQASFVIACYWRAVEVLCLETPGQWYECNIATMRTPWTPLVSRTTRVAPTAISATHPTCLRRLASLFRHCPTRLGLLARQLQHWLVGSSRWRESESGHTIKRSLG